MKRVLVAMLIFVGFIAIVFALRAHFVENHAGSPVASAAPKQLWTCRMHPQIVQDHPGLCPICGMPLTPMVWSSDGGELLKPTTSPSGMTEFSAGPAVVIDPSVVQNMGVRTATVTRGPLTYTVRVVGMLTVPENAQFEVNPRVNGWIEKLYANQEGVHVHKGEVLFDLYSPDLQVAQEELIGAIASLNSLDPKSTDAARSQTQGLVDSAKAKLALLGVAEQDIDVMARAAEALQTVPFRSPADGEIEDKTVVEGSAVQSGMKLMRIEDHSKLWLQAQVYEQQMPIVKIGQAAEATFESIPGTTFTGPIDFIYPHLDPQTRTISVRITIDSQNHELKPGMYATVRIMTKASEDALLAPREAVIDSGTRQIAFVVRSPGHFEPRNVRMGLAGDGGLVQILQGLGDGETVVTSGQFLMDVTSRTDEALQKLRGNSTAH